MKRVFALSACLFATLASGANLSDLTLHGRGEACAELRQLLSAHLHFETAKLPPQHQAGQNYTGTVRFSKDFALSADHYLLEHVFARVQLKTDKPYEHRINLESQESLTDFLFSNASSLEVTLSKEIRKHVGGEFELLLMVNLIGAKGHCFGSGRFDKKVFIHSDDVRITPPLLRSLSFDKPSYLAGESATATFTVSTPLGELETGHFEWINPEKDWQSAERGFPKFDNDIKHRIQQNNDGSYSITFQIPHSAAPGLYYLSYFNRQDELENFESSVGDGDAEERNVKMAHPIIVTSREHSEL